MAIKLEGAWQGLNGLAISGGTFFGFPKTDIRLFTSISELVSRRPACSTHGTYTCLMVNQNRCALGVSGVKLFFFDLYKALVLSAGDCASAIQSNLFCK